MSTPAPRSTVRSTVRSTTRRSTMTSAAAKADPSVRIVPLGIVAIVGSSVVVTVIFSVVIIKRRQKMQQLAEAGAAHQMRDPNSPSTAVTSDLSASPLPTAVPVSESLLPTAQATYVGTQQTEEVSLIMPHEKLLS